MGDDALIERMMVAYDPLILDPFSGRETEMWQAWKRDRQERVRQRMTRVLAVVRAASQPIEEVRDA